MEDKNEAKRVKRREAQREYLAGLRPGSPDDRKVADSIVTLWQQIGQGSMAALTNLISLAISNARNNKGE